MENRSRIYHDLVNHIMTKVTNAANGVVQLTDDRGEQLSLYRQAILALLAEMVFTTAPKNTTRSEIMKAVKIVCAQVPEHFDALMDEFSDKQLKDLLRRR